MFMYVCVSFILPNILQILSANSDQVCRSFKKKIYNITYNKVVCLEFSMSNLTCAIITYLILKSLFVTVTLPPRAG